MKNNKLNKKTMAGMGSQIFQKLSAINRMVTVALEKDK
jgi:hypothetical protein